MTAEVLLARLEGVRQSGPGRWIARCPAHDDRHPSLSVRELEDGRVLVHDFGGCATEEVLQALSLEFDALFPEKPSEYARGERRPFYASDVLRALVDELLVVEVIAADLEHGRPVKQEDFDRLRLAIERIQAGRRLALGER